MKHLLFLLLFLLPHLGFAQSSAINFPTVGPVISGFQGSDWSSTTYTFTYGAGLGTVTNSNVFARRVGDSLEVTGTALLGTTAGTIASIIMPTGLAIDTTKLPSNTSGTAVGWFQGQTTGASTAFPASAAGPFVLFYDGTTNSSVYISGHTASSAYVKEGGSTLFGNNIPVTFYFKVPIAGWSTVAAGGSSGYYHGKITGSATVGYTYNSSTEGDWTVTGAPALTNDADISGFSGCTQIASNGSGVTCTAPLTGKIFVEVTQKVCIGAGNGSYDLFLTDGSNNRIGQAETYGGATNYCQAITVHGYLSVTAGSAFTVKTRSLTHGGTLSSGHFDTNDLNLVDFSFHYVK